MRISTRVARPHGSELVADAILDSGNLSQVNIGAEDLAGEGPSQRKLVLGLTWTLILRYEIHQFGGNEAELMDWVKKVAKDCGTEFHGSWGEAFGDGRAFCNLVHDAEPKVCFGCRVTICQAAQPTTSACDVCECPACM
jgi:hypothetical protein